MVVSVALREEEECAVAKLLRAVAQFNLRLTRWDLPGGAKALSQEQRNRLEESRRVALQRRSARKVLTAQQRSRLEESRKKAVAKKKFHEAWLHALVPQGAARSGIRVPKGSGAGQHLGVASFLELQRCGCEIAFDWLMKMHPHQRDDKVVFIAQSHTYLLEGQPSQCSVTALVHRFSVPFDADAVIERMQKSVNWPRAQYCRLMGR